MPDHVEIVYFKEPWQTGNECYEIQAAINGVLALPGQVHASFREKFPDTKAGQDAFMAMMIQGQKSMVDLFGDAREQRPIPVEEFV